HRSAHRSGGHADREFLAARALLGRLRRRDSALAAPEDAEPGRRRRFDPQPRPGGGHRAVRPAALGRRPGPAFLHHELGGADLADRCHRGARRRVARIMSGCGERTAGRAPTGGVYRPRNARASPLARRIGFHYPPKKTSRTTFDPRPELVVRKEKLAPPSLE